MNWDLEELGDEAVTLRREDGLVLRAVREETPPDEGERASGAVTWRFTVDTEHGERLADHGWEIVDDEHLWEVLDGFTYRFRRDAADDDSHTDEADEKQDERADDSRDDRTAGDRDEESNDTQEADEPESATGTDSVSPSADPGAAPSSPTVDTESGAGGEDTDTAPDHTPSPTHAEEDGSVTTDRAIADGPAPAGQASQGGTGEATTGHDEGAPNAGAERDESRRGGSGSDDSDSNESNDTEDVTDRPDTEETTSDQAADPTADEHEAPNDPARTDPPAETGGNEDTEPTDRGETGVREASVRIRQARPDDADRLAAVYRSAYAQNRELGFPAKAESVTPAMLRAWIDENGVIVATVEDTVVGGVRLEATAPDRVKVSRLGVHADWKAQGVGSKLLAAAEAAVDAGNADTIWLTTPPEHPFLPDFYRDRGYERIDEYPLDERDYDEIVMEKRVG
ncbi:acetyltransferase (GNAT) family protein [Halovivax ruber XH-70]|uniref:Acetyltransferase (GNAT) family protein n=1 Tax=Halovivax ruber (strain DSM 18193 / JCM 13892 / XH-70) TaxID=797302 RepID=L0I9V6_HALRX|nr:GNAT family N-acetyltransferase [Halovivax ruber]AGB15504.1 acetyltransferase (GNAT) family protein [Halovivax ruber XH-70]